MVCSVFDTFKHGIGPSSSHAMGPMVAANAFVQALREQSVRPLRGKVSLHGSWAFSGKGHASDRAIFLGLLGARPGTLDPDKSDAMIDELNARHQLCPAGLDPIKFNPVQVQDLEFDYGPPFPGHPNGMKFQVLDAEGACVLSETYDSIGGGFIVNEEYEFRRK